MGGFTVPKYRYPAQFAGGERELLGRIEELLLRGGYVLGEEVAAFEERLAAYLGAARTIGVNSGTDALILTLDALGVGPGDEVVTVANSFHATAQAIARRGATPVYVDCREDDFLMDLDRLPDALTERTRALILVHMFGKAADVPRALRLAHDAGVTLVEDCAQAIGARSHGVRVGTASAAGCWSFAPSKNLAAAGDAGAISVQDAGLAERLRLLRHFGQPRQNEHEILGYNSRLDTLQALILLHKLDRLDTWNGRRAELAATYRERLGHLPLRFQRPGEDGEHVYHLFQVRTESETVRDGLLAHLIASGVDAVVRYPVPLPHQPALAGPAAGRHPCPVAEELARQTLCLPIRPDLSAAEIGHVCDAVAGWFGAEAA
ncbi:DegT/DnrJ/EryC1/StrS family aminotransferase [Streptomyces albus subsp. chlorinus]|uniref:DegT/DnrJ/EryC1/StrS family aminotransferase n=1 Tax=Streptomyces albus TaxID=1888 RepID=UPI0015705AFE|nr:DegT/DnrJ/EryC1/StrS family aminotransferase [Streptomyces albus]NSC24955.1 DegT/DnrJ/EryC1/StrS family aminotransferase [Streptomyces albus subsp. chlorinus]